MGGNSRIEISQTNAIKNQICLERKQIKLTGAVMLVVILFLEGTREEKTVQLTVAEVKVPIDEIISLTIFSC